MHCIYYNSALRSNLPLWCADRSCVICVGACVCACVLEHIKIPCRNVRNISYDLPSYFRIRTSLTTSRVYWTVGISSFQISANLQWSCAERNTNGRQVILKSTSVIRNRFSRHGRDCFLVFPARYSFFQFSYILSCLFHSVHNTCTLVVWSRVWSVRRMAMKCDTVNSTH
jgi:hypothetical protein